MTLGEAMLRYPPMWTIYDHPSDHPEEFVVRVWYGEHEGPLIAECDTAEEARRTVVGQGASACLGREPQDDPVILETWI